MRQFNKRSTVLNLVIFSILFIIFLGYGCGGGNGDNQIPVKEGRFLDSPVEGLAYETLTQYGITNSEGIFKYQQGESIQFSIGKIVLGQCLAKEIVTPIDLVDEAIDQTNPRVTNICRFILTLDDDNNINNGILITESIRDAAQNFFIDFDLPIMEFDKDPLIEQTVNSLTALTSEGQRNLISINEANNHLENTLISIQHIEQKIIGPEGGIIEVNNPSSPLFGVRLEIQKGALDEDTLITICCNLTKEYVEEFIGELPEGISFYGGLNIDMQETNLIKPAILSIQNRMGALSHEQILFCKLIDVDGMLPMELKLLSIAKVEDSELVVSHQEGFPGLTSGSNFIFLSFHEPVGFISGNVIDENGIRTSNAIVYAIRDSYFPVFANGYESKFLLPSDTFKNIEIFGFDSTIKNWGQITVPSPQPGAIDIMELLLNKKKRDEETWSWPSPNQKPPEDSPIDLLPNFLSCSVSPPEICTSVGNTL